MALTLTITSFTCTFPVVGGLLVMASTGQFFYPIIGLATFATVLALPFFLLALSPGLLSKVPKSGDWMNAVKVVGGLVEIGAAFKFLNTAEIAFVTPENAWIDAQFVLTAWVVLAAVCGFYLLGFFRTDHDHEEVKVGPGRMILGTGFLGIALFLAPALFGRPPQEPGLGPPRRRPPAARRRDRLPRRGADDARLRRGHSRRRRRPTPTRRRPSAGEDVPRRRLGDELRARPSSGPGPRSKPILIDFTGVNCAELPLDGAGVLPPGPRSPRCSRFVTVQLYTDFVPIASITADQREELARKNQERQST